MAGEGVYFFLKVEGGGGHPKEEPGGARVPRGCLQGRGGGGGNFFLLGAEISTIIKGRKKKRMN